MGTVPDNMAGIFDGLKEAALTMQQGGGIGYDFSHHPPTRGRSEGRCRRCLWPAVVHGCVGCDVPHHHVGRVSRRGAMMATMRCDHPDIEAFIEAKRDPARLRMFNLSVLVTDPFMAAVKADGPWELVFDGKVYKTLQARDLWNKIMKSTYEFAEPGVIFIDRINAMNNLNYVRNDCRHQPLRRTAVAALWRVSAWVDQHGDAGDRCV